MINVSTIKLLRIPFSFFLSPIYFFALAQVPHINWFNAVLIFFIIHFLIYPASNGYNSYMDRDTESIGGLEKPPPPSRQLFWVTCCFGFDRYSIEFDDRSPFSHWLCYFISAHQKHIVIGAFA
jgi:1,4-dihydroxy-2-naphthoate octaprenyltransferase